MPTLDSLYIYWFLTLFPWDLFVHKRKIFLIWAFAHLGITLRDPCSFCGLLVGSRIVIRFQLGVLTYSCSAARRNRAFLFLSYNGLFFPRVFRNHKIDQ